MTREEFKNKLSAFFTDEQIANMETFALECAQDTIVMDYADDPMACDLADVIGQERTNVCLMISDAFGCADPAAVIEGFCGCRLSDEATARLAAQVVTAW